MNICFSPRFCLLLVSTHLLAAIIVYATAMPLVFKIVAILLAAISLVYYLARDVFIFLPTSWHRISLAPDGVKVTISGGSSFLGQVAGATIVSGYCIMFRVRLDRHHFLVSRVIFPDSLSQGEFRNLSVGLRFS